MKPIYYIRLIVLVGLFINSSQVFSIGDSGGISCNEPEWIELAINGKPSELDAAINEKAQKGVDYEFEQRKNSQKSSTILRWLGKEDPAIYSLTKMSLNVEKNWLINRNYGCIENGFTLLDMAAAAGNLENVAYLLAQGADPNAITKDGETIFMRCADLDENRKHIIFHRYMQEDRRSPEQIAAKLSAYVLLLKSGGNINARTKSSGDTALHLCDDSASIGLFLESSAKLQENGRGLNPLDSHVINLFGKFYKQQEPRAVDIIKLIAKDSGKQKTDHKDANWKLCIECGRDDKYHADVCESLSFTFRAMDSRFFKGKVSIKNEKMQRSRECSMLSENR